MARYNQPDLFAEPEPDLFADAPRVTYRPEPDMVRARLQKILAEARAAQALPSMRANLYRTIVPQLALWLPEEEAAQWCLDFETEMARLETD